jgi:hypothetical protein
MGRCMYHVRSQHGAETERDRIGEHGFSKTHCVELYLHRRIRLHDVVHNIHSYFGLLPLGQRDHII